MRGVVITAYMNGNTQIPYAELAILSACMIQRRLGPIPITLFADAEARERLSQHSFRFSRLFREIIDDDAAQTKNLRQFPGTNCSLIQFNNSTRAQLYGRVEYDEMLIIDTDYLLYEDSLSQVWNGAWPIRINRRTASIRYPMNASESRLGDLTIPLYWATAAYFRRCAETDRFFRLVEYAQENYEWFSHVYRYDHRLFRNDYTYSIAAHLLGGQIGECPSIASLPNNTLRFAWDDDKAISFDDHGLWFASHDYQGKPEPIQIVDQNIHVLNKPSLIPFLGRMIHHEWGMLK